MTGRGRARLARGSGSGFETEGATHAAPTTSRRSSSVVETVRTIVATLRQFRGSGFPPRLCGLRTVDDRVVEAKASSRGSRRVLTRKRLLIALFITIGIVAVGWLTGRYALARGAVQRALAAGGLEPAAFQVRSVGLSSVQLTNLSVGSTPWITANSVEATFSLRGLLAGRAGTIRLSGVQWTIESRGGAINWGYKPAGNRGAGTLDLPFDAIELSGSVIRVATDDRRHDIQVEGGVARAGGDTTLELWLSAAGENWEVPRVRGSVQRGPVDTAAMPIPATILTAVIQTERPLSLDLRAAGVTGLVRSVEASARVQMDGSGMHVLDGRATLQGASLEAGDLALSDGHAEVVAPDAETLQIKSLAAVIGDGSDLRVEPLTLKLAERRVQARLTMENLSLLHWLPIITANHATGEGRVSGHVDVTIDWSSGSLKLAGLTGSLRADPEHGFIQTTDADALAELLERQDPRFATDQVMRPVRDKIIAALRDFRFTKLTVDLSRPEDHTVALTYLSGFGRHGEDPQGLNLTLDLHVHDSFASLAARIAGKSRMKGEARRALDSFFQGAPLRQEEP
jgi:hypothetical protein